MDDVDGVAALNAVLLAGSAVALALPSIRFRCGASQVAPWWVRRVPAARMGLGHNRVELIALGLVPFLAQLCAVLGCVLLLKVHPAVRDAVYAQAAWTVAISEILLGIAFVMLCANRRTLPLRLHRRWLRPQRRAERDVQRAR